VNDPLTKLLARLLARLDEAARDDTGVLIESNLLRALVAVARASFAIYDSAEVYCERDGAVGAAFDDLRRLAAEREK
jgi:hypothetical protein